MGKALVDSWRLSLSGGSGSPAAVTCAGLLRGVFDGSDPGPGSLSMRGYTDASAPLGGTPMIKSYLFCEEVWDCSRQVRNPAQPTP